MGKGLAALGLPRQDGKLVKPGDLAFVAQVALALKTGQEELEAY